jgi:hypothetical protein
LTRPPGNFFSSSSPEMVERFRGSEGLSASRSKNRPFGKEKVTYSIEFLHFLVNSRKAEEKRRWEKENQNDEIPMAYSLLFLL